MKDLVRQYLERFICERRNRRRRNALLALFSLLVAAAVFWQLHGIGFAIVSESFCGEEEHQHEESCEEEVPVCGQEEDPAHIHTDDCYETAVTCQIPEHTHTADCLTDLTADVETAEDWEETLPALSGAGAADVAAIAQSQIGYFESEKNFQLAEDGMTRQGYTRYGAWYGNPYGDWDAMFASFCVFYAGMSGEGFPLNSGAYAWTADLAGQGLYADADAYHPAAGDLVFLDRDGDARADYVGVLTQGDEGGGTITMIAGDSHDAVEEVTASRGEVLGYGILAKEEIPQETLMEEAETPGIKRQANTLDGYLEVSWSDGSVTYIQGRDDDKIQKIYGRWSFSFRLDTVRDGVFLADGEYACPLVLPEGNVKFSQTKGLIQTEEGAAQMGEWAIDSGVLRITVSIPQEAVDAVGGIVRQDVTIERVDTEGDSEITRAHIEKTGSLAAGSQKIVWTLSEVTIPRYSLTQNNGIAAVWNIEDEQKRLSGKYDLANKPEHLDIRLSSTQYPDGKKRVPPIGEASGEDQIAFSLRQIDDEIVQIDFLNRCHCTEDNCPNYTTECGNTRDQDGHPYTDADGALWCGCWLYPYNAVFTVTYQTDASAIWYWIAKNGNEGTSSRVWNTATLQKDGDYVIDDGDGVLLERLLSKSETERPADHDGVGTFEILINEKGYSMADTDCLVVTDTLENLAHLVDIGENPRVTADQKPLKLLDENEAAGLGREGNEDTYYSLSCTDTLSEEEEGEKTGEVMTIKIWYPTSLTYRICYDATVIGATEQNQGRYSNTAKIQEVFATVGGDMGGSWASWYAYGKKLLLTKKDADTAAPLSEGAEFAFYRCREDGEETLLNTLTTDQEGKLEFHTDRSLGYVLAADRLYCAVETKAPEGYEKSDRRYYFYFSEEGIDPDLLPEDVDAKDLLIEPIDENGNAIIYLDVENQKLPPAGPLLPSTGGPGTARFLWIGAALLLGSLLLLNRSRIRRFIRRSLAKFCQH